MSEKIKKLKEEVRKAYQGDSGSVRIVAVTKGVDAETVNETLDHGISEIGENRVQEAKLKLCSVSRCTRHFIGHLQRNKVKEAVRLFDSIDSVDSYALAELICVEAERSLKKMPVLVQVNIADDEDKYGLSMDEVPHFVRKISILKWLDVQGLMAIIPMFGNPDDGRGHFRRMKELLDKLSGTFPGLVRLSMGMTNDFRVALEEGANEIRIGSYLFK